MGTYLGVYACLGDYSIVLHVIGYTVCVNFFLFAINLLYISSMSKNPIGDEGFEMLLDALIAKPKGSLKKLG